MSSSHRVRKTRKVRIVRRKSYKNYLLIFAACAAVGFLLSVSPSGIAKLWDVSKASILKQMFHYQPMDGERQSFEEKQMEILKKLVQ
ncbi:MAG: hypothetical protein HY279_06770 [Nitrospinae bacterium]|nr:hypothetical protein [Nitrospinota bacterium]